MSQMPNESHLSIFTAAEKARHSTETSDDEIGIEINKEIECAFDI